MIVFVVVIQISHSWWCWYPLWAWITASCLGRPSCLLSSSLHLERVSWNSCWPNSSHFWITFVDTSAPITLRWKGSDPYASTTTGTTFVLSPRSFGTSLARSWYFSTFTASFFLPSQSFVIGKSIIWQHLCLLIPQFGPLAVIHYMFEHWIPSKTWSFLFSFRLNLHFSARTQWIAPATLSFLVFDSCASFGHEHRIWLAVSASALPLVNLCFHVIST